MSTQRTSRGNPLDRLGQSMARSFFERAQGARAKRLERLSPTARVLLSFGLLILCGTFLLWLPACAAAGQPGLSFVDALFTSTSAVCVTGLSTIDVGLRLSGLGQGVLLLLIQLGGLGFLTLSTGLFFSLGFRSSMLTRAAVADTLGGRTGSEMRGLLRNLFLVTMIFELAGAAVLSFRFASLEGFTLGQACWFGLFHSVSAFCNAGFSTFSRAAGHGSDGLDGFTQDGITNLVTMALIVLGGLGFLVLEELLAWLRGRGQRRLGVHAKIVLSTSAVLTAAGAALFYLFERQALFEGRPWHEALLPSLFQSVTARTAGFNTVSVSALSGPTLMLLMGLMFIGGSPASTAGGVKTTTAFVILRLTLARLSRRRHPTAFGRELSTETVTRAATLILVAIVCLVVLSASLMVIEARSVEAHSRGGVFMDMLFESVSALGTVGLSTGTTGDLGALAKLVVIVAMYVGRLGPLSVFVALAQPPRTDKVRYPEASVLVG
ncbi:MAG: potassium-transporting ATPase subunit KdpA [Planctomycetota bacterium]|nr:potassium-transporting ATPase subunit KdpA [Planctomycetota bacterium]